MTDKMENFDAFCDAMKFPAELKTLMKTTTQFFELTKEGDKYKYETTIGEGKEVFVYKLGEKFHSSGFGVEAENLYEMKDNVLCGTHTANGITTLSKTRFAPDGVSIIGESEVNGIVQKNFYVRA